MNEAVEKIHFHYLSQPFSFPARNKLKEFLLNQLKKEGKAVEVINYIFCTDEYLLQMNQQYLQHDTLTDIITFELSRSGKALISDIYISIDRVKENAVSFRQPFVRELHRVIFHGVLHLAGYKDKKEKDKNLMQKKEEEYLNVYFVSRRTVSE